MASSSESEVRYRTPKILLIDLPHEAFERLRASGFNVSEGSFGSLYDVPRSDQYGPLICDPALPNLPEQELLFIELGETPHSDRLPDAHQATLGEFEIWASCRDGLVDPRPLAMRNAQRWLNRAFQHGAMFVVFAESRRETDWVTAKSVGGGLYKEKELRIDNWSFLSILSADQISISVDAGREIRAASGGGFIGTFLETHLAGAEFRATFTPDWELSKNSSGPTYLSILENKYGASVGGLIVDNDPAKWILLLPHVEDKPALIYALVTQLLPMLSPRLFPDSGVAKWLHSPQYEHPSVSRLRERQRAIREDTDRQMAELEEEIRREHETLSFFHGVLTNTDDALVADVKQLLEFLGFEEIVDADALRQEGQPKEEDLQIKDRSPALLVEVKGIGKMPREGETLQVTKYILRRMREWNRTDVGGVTIINQQRYLPPHERDHKSTFTSQQIEDAKNHGILLATTWELYRLARGTERWNWPPEAIKSLFYRTGRISIVPAHYALIGTVAHFWDKRSAISIDLQSPLRVGDRIGFVLPVAYHEETIESMQVDRTDVSEAAEGQRVGVKTELRRSDLPEGTAVYRVLPEVPEHT